MISKINDHDTQYLFDLIGLHTELKTILYAITKWLENRIANAIVSIILFSETEQNLHIINGGAYFTTQDKEILDNFKISPDVSIYEKFNFNRLTSIINENFKSDPNWVSAQNLLKEKNMTACWSTPVINAQGILYGTFETYYYQSKKPTDESIRLLHRAAALIALALDLQNERQRRVAINDKHDSFFKHHPDGCFELDFEGKFVSVNLASLQLSGFPEEEIRGIHYGHWIHPEYQSTAKSAFNQALNGNIQHFELQTYPNAYGKTYWLNLTCLPIMQDKQVTGIFCIAQDITTRHITENNLRLLKRGVSASPNGMIMTDADGDMPIVYVNPAFLSMTGYTEAEVLGKNCRFLQGQDSDPSTIRKIRQALREKYEIEVTLKNYRKDGSSFWNKLTLAPVLDEVGNCTHFVGIQQDITKQRIQEEHIAHLHTHDNLTNLPNRQYFETQLQKSFEHVKNTQHPLFILYIDLDDFRLLNDSLGYFIGDQLIKAVSLRMQSLMQENDLLARFAGDEFIVMLTQFNQKQDVIQFVENILSLLSKPFYIAKEKIYITASIGIIDNTANIQHPNDLLHHSELAMNEAKRRGRNTWHWYEVDKKNLNQINYFSLRNDLIDALKEKQFKIYYQPLVDPLTGEVKAVEALIRWEHPQKGLMSPDTFIPFAERTGQIVAIGQWILQQACLDIADWNIRNHTSLNVAVNISPLQFRRSGFLQELQQVLAASNLPANLLKIEVIESMLIAEADRSIEILQTIRSLGVQVAIDDFGTGYSSLSYLRRLPANQIKLDRSFIKDIPHNSQDAAIVQAIITLAHQLGLEVVAEGVETADQAIFLTQNGCDMLQGYYYARPAPLDNLRSTYSPCVIHS
ncbi:sensor domain-containing protein [Acinetobacter sp. ANC 5584]